MRIGYGSILKEKCKSPLNDMQNEGKTHTNLGTSQKVRVKSLQLGDGSIFLEVRIFVSHSRLTAATYAICNEGP